MWLVNVVLHVFEHLAKRSKYCGYVTCGGVCIFHRRGGPIFHILPHWWPTRSPRLWHIHYWTYFFKFTEQYHNIPVACKGVSLGNALQILPKSWCNPHGCRDTKWVKKNAIIFCVLHMSSLHFYFSVHTIQCKDHIRMTVIHIVESINKSV